MILAFSSFNAYISKWHYAVINWNGLGLVSDRTTTT